MDRERWQRVQALFHEAADLPTGEQRAFLETCCEGDATLVVDVMALLEEDAQGDSLLDRDVGQLAHEILEETSEAAESLKDFGPYRIRTVIGEGGMGVVYLAERKDLWSQVAIKVLRDAWVSPARRERFTLEQRTLAQLNHPFIARLYDADSTADGTPFFVMEYVEGVPITAYCREHKPSVAVRLELFRKVCEAVLYAHQHAVIHRDLKPSNILVKEDGTVRLLDFGIAKQVQILGEAANQTIPGARLLTPAYAAPEQLRGEATGIQGDVYSLGVVLYQLLTNRHPFDGAAQTSAQAERALTERKLEKPSAVAGRQGANSQGREGGNAEGKAVWADLDVLCVKAMHPEVQQRYASVEALIRDIDHYLKGEPLEARPDSRMYRLRKFAARNRTEVIVGAVTIASVLALVIYFTVRLAHARNTAVAEAARTLRIQQFMTNLFQGGDAAAGPADQLRVVSLLDRGVQEADALSEPAMQADLYATLGSIYQKLGKYERADALLGKALEKRRAIYGGSSPQTAESLIALGMLRAEQARLDDAERLVREGLEIERRRTTVNGEALAKAELAFGRVLAQRGSYEPAIAELKKAVELESKQGAQPVNLAASLAALADAHYSAGHYEQANELYQGVLEMHRQIYGPTHPLVADDLGNLGSIQQDLGYYAEAEQLNRQVLEIEKAYYGAAHPKVAKALTTLGRSELYQKKYDEAEEALAEALGINEKVYGRMHPEVADTLNELGNVASMKGNYPEAEKRFTEVAEIYRTAYGDKHYLVAIALSNVAYAYLNQKLYARSEEMFRDVVQRFTAALSADNVNTGIARIKLGRALLRQDKFGEAEQETRAGYEILKKQTSPSISFLQAARKDLAAEYDGLQQPEKAAAYREEHAAAEKAAMAKK